MFNRLNFTQTTSVSPQFYDRLGYASLLVSVLGGAILGGIGGCVIDRHLQENRNDYRLTSEDTYTQSGWVQEEHFSSSSIDRMAFGTLFGLIGGYVLVGMPCQLILLQLSQSQDNQN